VGTMRRFNARSRAILPPFTIGVRADQEVRALKRPGSDPGFYFATLRARDPRLYDPPPRSSFICIVAFETVRARACHCNSLRCITHECISVCTRPRCIGAQLLLDPCIGAGLTSNRRVERSVLLITGITCA